MSWPADSPLVPEPGQANLVLLVHPHCPCTRASLDELEEVLARCEGLVTAHVLFYRHHDSPPNWEKGDLWRRAVDIAGVRVLCDEDAAYAQRLGAATSGDVLLYHADGRLLFHGGITESRGHAGPSVGSAAIVSLLREETTAPAQTPVFGCPLSERCRRDSEGVEPWVK